MPQSINYLHLIIMEWRKVAAVAVLAGLLALLGSFARPLEYSSTVRLLIIQRSTLGLDPYTAIRSAERVSENLANVVYTTSFFDKVLSAGFNVDRAAFKQDERKRRAEWQRIVATEIARGTGLLTITVYHRDRTQAEQIAYAIGTVLQKEGWTYVGGGDLQVKIVDTPLTSRLPVRPNLLGNAFGGLILGLFLGMGYVVFLEQQSRRHPGRSFTHGI